MAAVTICSHLIIRKLGFPGGAMVRNPPANAGDAHMHKTRVPSLGREDQPSPVFLPGESHGQGSLVGYSPWGCQEPDMTKRLSMHTLIKRKNLNSNSGLCRWQEKKTKLFVKEKNSLLVPMLPSKENGS